MAGGLRRRGSVASLNSISSFACSTDEKEAWKELCRELHWNGVTADMVNTKHGEVLEVFRATTLFNISDRPHDDVVQRPDMNQEGNRAQKIDMTPVGSVIEVLRLLGTGSSMDDRNSAGETALHVAASKGRTDLVKVLLDEGAIIHTTSSSRKRTAFHSAATNGHLEAVEMLLDRGATIDSTTIGAWTTLHEAASEGHANAVKTLLDRGADISARTKENCTALHLAAINSYIEAVKALLDRGASINAAANGKTAFHLAAEGGHVEVVELLLDEGATINGKIGSDSK